MILTPVVEQQLVGRLALHQAGQQRALAEVGGYVGVRDPSLLPIGRQAQDHPALARAQSAEVAGHREVGHQRRRDRILPATAADGADQLADRLGRRRATTRDVVEEGSVAIGHRQREHRAQDRAPVVPARPGEEVAYQFRVVDEVDDRRLHSGHPVVVGHAAPRLEAK
jgi:hypothetical protein